MSVSQILSGVPAGLSQFASVGEAVILAGSDVVIVPDTRITAQSVIVCWGLGQADGTARVFSADDLIPIVGFSLYSNTTATANKRVGYAVIKY